MKIFYHNDNDGRCAARQIIEKYNITEKESLFEMDYSKAFPFDIINKHEIIWIVDYSIKPEEMERLLAVTANVFWIDHHKTAIDQYKDFSIDIQGLRIDGISGCELTWLYINYPNHIQEAKETISALCPYYVRLIGDRDVWKWEFGNNTKFFDLGTKILILHPLSDDWHEIEYSIPKLINNGEIIGRYFDIQAEEYMSQYGYKINWEGYKCFIVNKRAASEEYGENNKKYQICVSYFYNGNKWTVSLRSNLIDVSEIAKKYGGGGHKSAAGFTCKELPKEFLLNI